MVNGQLEDSIILAIIEINPGLWKPTEYSTFTQGLQGREHMNMVWNTEEQDMIVSLHKLINVGEETKSRSGK